MAARLLLAASVALLAATSAGAAGPEWPKAYTASGYILLPYCELKETFEAYYDATAGKSRIDFYGGEMKTFQSQEATIKVFWQPNEKTHVPEQNCFNAGGAAAQSVLPDLGDFKYVRDEPCETDSTTVVKPLLVNRIQDTKCSRYENEVNKFGRVSKYTFWAQKDEDNNVIPVRYLMMGYDSLLGSHFDKYEVVYTDYTPGPVDADVFDVKTVIDKDCLGNSAPGGLSTGHLFNPMAEFIHGKDSHVDEHFDHFKAEHGKAYETTADEGVRKINFRHNMRFVNSMNRRNLSYALKLNHRSDWSQNEFRSLRGRLREPVFQSQGKTFDRDQFRVRSLPAYVDWRLEGAVSPVKDQAICGSCWSFGAVGNVEGAYFLKHGQMVRLAEQQLVDCSWANGNNACDGGWDTQAFDYIIKYGLASDEQYGAYRGIDGKCKDLDIKDKPIATLTNYTTLSGVDNLQKALAFVGPISVSIDASRPAFSFYSHGVFKDPDCSSSDLDHVVLAVGYGTLHGEPYWLIKNSWSTYWGNDGYVLISRENNMCGVATSPSYVEL